MEEFKRYEQSRNAMNKRVIEFLKANHGNLPHGFFVSNKSGTLRLCYKNKHDVFCFADIYAYKNNKDEQIHNCLHFITKNHTYWKHCDNYSFSGQLEGLIHENDKYYDTLISITDKFEAESILSSVAFCLDKIEMKG